MFGTKLKLLNLLEDFESMVLFCQIYQKLGDCEWSHRGHSPDRPVLQRLKRRYHVHALTRLPRSWKIQVAKGYWKPCGEAWHPGWLV